MYNVRFRLEFTDELGNNKRIDVLQRDYEGGIEEVTGAGFSPVITRMERQGDEKFEVMKGTEIDFSVFSEENFQILDVVKTASERELQLALYENNDLKHIGFVIPEVYDEPYTDTPYPSTLRAVALGALQGIEYKENGEFITGRVSQIDVVSRCLGKLGFDLNIHSAINTYADEMVALSTLFEVEVDQEAYIIDERGRRKALSCYEVLERILAPYNAHLIQDDGVWKIIPFELRGNQRDERVYLSDGTFDDTITVNPEDTDYTWLNQSMGLSHRPALREFSSVYEHGTLGNIVLGGDFNEPLEDFIPPFWDRSDPFSAFGYDDEGSIISRGFSADEGGPRLIRFNTNVDTAQFGYKLIDSGSYIENIGRFLDPSSEDRVNLRFKWRVASENVGADYSQDIQFRVGDNYLTSDGSWTTTPTDISIEDAIPSGVEFREFEIESEEIPSSGDIIARIYRPLVDGVTPSEQNQADDIRFSEYPYFDVQLFTDGDPETESRTYVGSREIESFAEEDSFDLFHGDGPTNLHRSALTVEGNRTTGWQRSGVTGTLSEVFIRKTLSEYQNPVGIIQGERQTSKRFDAYIVDQGTTYTINAGEYDERLCRFTGQHIEVFDSNVGSSVAFFDEEQTGQRQPSGSGSTDQTQDGRYFRQSQNLAEGDPSAIRGNIGLGTIATFDGDQNLGTTDEVTFDQANVNDAIDPTHALNLRAAERLFITGQRELTFLGLDGITVDPETQDLTEDRTWELSVDINDPLRFENGSIGIEDHGLDQRGVVNTGTQNIYGRKQFQSESQFTDDVFLDKGQVWDDFDSFLSSTTFAGGFAGSGIQIERVNGQWVATVDGLVVRDFARFYELIVEKVRAAGGTLIINDGMRVESVEQTGQTWNWDDTEPVFDSGGTQYSWNNRFKCFIEEDLLVEFTVDDLVKSQTYTGRGIEVIRGTVTEVEGGNQDPTVNTPARFFEIYTEAGSGTVTGNEDFVRFGNLTDPDRQGGIILTSSDVGAPYTRMYNGLDSWSKENTMDIIKYQAGKLDNITDPDFPSLDGSQTNLYGVYVDGGFFNNVEVRGKITILDEVGSNAATKEFVDNAVGQGQGNVVIRSDTPPSERPSGAGLVVGDTWIKTDEGDLPHTWNGSGWVRSYTIIDGGDLTTGSVTADKISIGSVTDIDSDAALVSDIITDYGELSGLPTLGNVSELNSITSTFISDGAVITAKIAAGAVVADKISVNDLEALDADIGGWEIGDRYMRKLLDGFSSSHVHLSSDVWLTHRTIGAGVFFASEVGDGNIKVAHVGQLHATDTITPSSDYGFEVIQQVTSTDVKHLVRMGGGDFFITNADNDFKIDQSGIELINTSSNQVTGSTLRFTDGTSEILELYSVLGKGIITSTGNLDIFSSGQQAMGFESGKVRIYNGLPLQLSQVTEAQRDNISAVNGMIIYNTTANRIQGFTQGTWSNL